MKYFKYIFILSLAGFISCSEDDPVIPLTPNLVTEIKTYDLGNNGNSSDIRVDFTVENNLEVFEYRVMILPAALMPQFDLKDAESIPSYQRLEPRAFEIDYSIPRLRSDLADGNGSPIVEGVEYVAVVLVIGTGDQQLSGFSRPFTLFNRGIFSGEYETIMGAEWNLSNGKILQAVLSDSADVYLGLLTGERASVDCSEASDDQNWGSVEFSVSGDAVTDFLWKMETHCVLPECEDLVSGGFLCGDCHINYEGTGTIDDEITFSLDYDAEGGFEPCYHGYTGSLNLIRK